MNGLAEVVCASWLLADVWAALRKQCWQRAGQLSVRQITESDPVSQPLTLGLGNFALERGNYWPLVMMSQVKLMSNCHLLLGLLGEINSITVLQALAKVSPANSAGNWIRTLPAAWCRLQLPLSSFSDKRGSWLWDQRRIRVTRWLRTLCKATNFQWRTWPGTTSASTFPFSTWLKETKQWWI